MVRGKNRVLSLSKGSLYKVVARGSGKALRYIEISIDPNNIKLDAWYPEYTDKPTSYQLLGDIGLTHYDDTGFINHWPTENSENDLGLFIHMFMGGYYVYLGDVVKKDDTHLDMEVVKSYELSNTN